MPLHKRASCTFCGATKKRFLPASLAAMTIGRTPLTGRTVPSNASSPIPTASSKLSRCNVPPAASIPIAIAKSSPAPSFFKSAGAKFTVILRNGNSSPEFFRAGRTLSLDSLTACVGKPTISYAGKPLAKSTSTKIK